LTVWLSAHLIQGISCGSAGKCFIEVKNWNKEVWISELSSSSIGYVTKHQGSDFRSVESDVTLI